MLLKADSVMYDFTTPMKATGFANIYLGMYRKTAVAVKEIKLIKSEQYVRLISSAYVNSALKT
jgi:hypothetical protein